jgi:hypothetical protein
MLENLVIAVESEAQVVDLGRVAGFMQKVRIILLQQTSIDVSFKVRDGII